MSLRTEDLCNIENPTLTVVTASLNQGRFLRQMIEAIIGQSFRDFEHIVIDGGSTDGTIDILKEYPHIRWISEKDNNLLAWRKGFAMARGKYIIQCCVSDGFLDMRWFRKCVDVLDNDEDISLVWALPQSASEDGDLLNVIFPELFTDPPPQKQNYFACWLATGLTMAEGNYCVRSEILREHFTSESSENYFQTQMHLGFVYQFMTHGYCPYFIPVVASFFRVHEGQRSVKRRSIEASAADMYFKRVGDYRRHVLRGEVTHSFRNGRSEVLGALTPAELWRLRMQIWRHRILRSRLLRRDLYTGILWLIRRLRG
jgi:glycosyltransferase involved in cell wall biosynthesis